MEVYIHLYSQAEPVHVKNVRNVYQKGDMYCVLQNDKDGKTVSYEFPLMHIFRVKKVSPADSPGCE